MKTLFKGREVIIAIKIAEMKELMLQIETEFLEFVKEHENCSITRENR